MSDYVIHAKLKNNRLLRRILEDSETVNEFCRKYNLNPSAVGCMVNMKKKALGEDGWRKIVIDLCDILMCSPEDLFTEEQAEAQLKSNEAFVEMTRQQALQFSEQGLSDEDRSEIRRLIFDDAPLTSKEKLVLKMRFEDECTFEEVGQKLDLSHERIRQIEAKALRKLRKPRTSKTLSQYLPETQWIGEANWLIDETEGE
jgi:RNA polymerase sigma factor (sigma-70 family)